MDIFEWNELTSLTLNLCKTLYETHTQKHCDCFIHFGSAFMSDPLVPDITTSNHNLISPHFDPHSKSRMKSNHTHTHFVLVSAIDLTH